MAKLKITRTGSTITRTGSTRERRMVCASPHAADVLEDRLKKDRAFAAKWLKASSPVQLHLPLDDKPGRPEQLDLEDAIAAKAPKP